VKPGPEADLVLLEHMLDCLKRINEYTGHEKARFVGSHLVQDAVIRNLQTLAEATVSDSLQRSREPRRIFRGVNSTGYAM
jgi:uncharacterized protein with HEPN domain